METTHPTSLRVTELAVTGMNCSGCARQVTDALQQVSGVDSAQVSLEQNRAAVRWKGALVPDVAALVQAVTRAGFTARPIAPGPEPSSAAGGAPSGPPDAPLPLNRWSSALLIAVGITAVLMAGDWIFRLGHETWYRWTSFLLAGLVQFGPGLQFYQGAWRQLKIGQSNMDTLVSLGSTTAFAYSTWLLFSGTQPHAHLFFMEAAAIITLISGGHWVEARVASRASSALQQLMTLAPARARRRAGDGSESEVSVASLGPGDIILLAPGDRVPVDAAVTEGQSAVDESMLTGESIPAEKAVGAVLCAGTVNLNGRLAARVTAVGEQTALARIIAAVQRAQTSRAAIQRLGDRVSSVFVPVVVCVAVAAGAWWGFWPGPARQLTVGLSGWLWAVQPPDSTLGAAIMAAAAVLIIACPCAMGLATPAAIMAGANAAARRGILIRDGVALEKAGRITTVLFDKTGTLTHGRPEILATRVVGAGGAALSSPPAGELERWSVLAASMAVSSTHPLSQAVRRLSGGRVELTEWQERQGAGLEAVRRGLSGGTERVRLGSLAWLLAEGVALEAASEGWVQEQSGEGATVVGLSVDSRMVLLVALRDTLKPHAAAVIGELRSQGLAVHMVTGDHPRAAATLAREAGIAPEFVHAQVRPEQKLHLVRQLQEAGAAVAFVGDGINDAPALEQADLGVAVRRASDIAVEAADIVLLRSDIEAVPESIALARATLRIIKQNLFWAFFYNALGIPLAALGFMSPVLCALAMGVSDLVVIGNALRLLRRR